METLKRIATKRDLEIAESIEDNCGDTDRQLVRKMGSFLIDKDYSQYIKGVLLFIDETPAAFAIYEQIYDPKDKLQLVLEEGDIYIEQLAVLDSFKRRRIGTTLVDKVLKAQIKFQGLDGFNARRLIVDVKRSNKAAIRFFEVNDFRNIGCVVRKIFKDDKAIRLVYNPERTGIGRCLRTQLKTNTSADPTTNTQDSDFADLEEVYINS